MRKGKRFMKSTALFLSLALLFVPMTSCRHDSNNVVYWPAVKSVKYTRADQAAAGSTGAAATVAVFDSISAVGSSSYSTSNPSGFAPGKQLPDTSNIGQIDPRLQQLVEGMLNTMKSASITDALSRAQSFKTISQTVSNATLSAGPCSGAGTFSVDGSDTSTGGYREYTVVITFIGCLDNSATTHTALDGTMSIYEKVDYATPAFTRNATLNLTKTSYIGGTLSSTAVLSGTFDVDYDGYTDFFSSANGSFKLTDGSAGQTTFYFKNVTDSWFRGVNGDGSIWRNRTLNGIFGYTAKSSSGRTSGFDIAVTGLGNSYTFRYDGTSSIQSVDHWINGTIAMSWTPYDPSGCIAGKVTFTTADATPLHSTIISFSEDAADGHFTYSALCPMSGILDINNATIKYGVPAPYGVTVTLDKGESKEYPDCTSIPTGVNSCFIY